jgi:hypothetical protein
MSYFDYLRGIKVDIGSVHWDLVWYIQDHPNVFLKRVANTESYKLRFGEVPVLPHNQALN